MTFQKIVNKLIIAHAAQNKPLDCRTITQKSLALAGNPKKASPGSNYRNLGLTLYFLSLITKDFDGYYEWLNETGLLKYLELIPCDQKSHYHVVHKAIFDDSLRHLFVPNTSKMEEWNVEVYKRIRRRLPVRNNDLQIVRQTKYHFFHCVASLRSLKSWKKVKNGFTIPRYSLRRGRSKGPAKRTVVLSQDCFLDYSPLAWVGSKKRLYHKIYPRLEVPKDGLLIEPFCGSATVSLFFKKERPDVQLHLNDACKPLYALLRTIRDCPAFLVDKLYNDKANAETWNRYRQCLLNNLGEISLEELGWMLYYVITYSYRQLGRNFCPTYDCKDVRKEVKFLTVSRLLQGANITCLDFREINEDGFMYVDPPYSRWASAKFQFYHAFSSKDYHDLVEMLKTRKNWLLSYDRPVTFPSCRTQRIQVKRSIGGRNRDFTEYLISP